MQPFLFQQTHGPSINPEDLQQPVQRGVQGDGQGGRQAGGNRRGSSPVPTTASWARSLSMRSASVPGCSVCLLAIASPSPLSPSGRLVLCQCRPVLAT